jgi:lysyl-tRNA synthetase class 2
MLEFYQAYANYHDLMDLTQELITSVANEVNGTAIANFNGHEIDLSKWQKLSMREAIIKFWPAGSQAPTLTDFHSTAQLAARLRAASTEMKAHRGTSGDIQIADSIEDTKPSTTHGRERARLADIEVYFEAVARNLDECSSSTDMGKIIAEIFESLAEEHLIQPTIIYDFPLAVSPLSKIKPGEPDWVERFEFYIGGFEVGNAFSELNDPDDQRRRFEDQLKERDRGDDEAHAMDEDYVRALSFGLPPTAGEGIGIDRLTMILTGSRSIRDVILFPLMRPLTKIAADEDEANGHTHGESAE